MGLTELLKISGMHEKKERKVVEVSHSIVRYVIEHTDIKLLQLVCRGDQR